MSKTDKTAPFWVKQTYHPTYLEEVHDHRFHDCNLPSRPVDPRDLRWYGQKDRPCFWWPSTAFWNSRWGRCGCPMCGWDSPYETRLRKRQRMEAKRYCQDGWRDEY